MCVVSRLDSEGGDDVFSGMGDREEKLEQGSTLEESFTIHLGEHSFLQSV